MSEISAKQKQEQRKERMNDFGVDHSVGWLRMIRIPQTVPKHFVFVWEKEFFRFFHLFRNKWIILEST